MYDKNSRPATNLRSADHGTIRRGQNHGNDGLCDSDPTVLMSGIAFGPIDCGKDGLVWSETNIILWYYIIYYYNAKIPPSDAHDRADERDGIHQRRQHPRFDKSTINSINYNNLAQFLSIQSITWSLA